jgi:hypothetical protein
MATIKEMEVQLQTYRQLQLEIKNLEEQAEQIRTTVNEILVENDIKDYEALDGTTVQKFTPKGRMMLNKGLVESFCKKNNLEIGQFYKETATSEQIKIIIPESKEKMEKYLKGPSTKELEGPQ